VGNKHKLTVVMVVLAAILGALFLGDGYLKTRRVERAASTMRASLSAMSIQELAGRVRECDPPTGSDQPIIHDAAYCAEVMRAIEDRPLQAVEIKPSAPLIPNSN
jgi:hypothetical protein